MIKIKTPFYSAGHKFKWPYSSPGLGINHKYFSRPTLEVQIGDNPTSYSVETSKAIEVIKRYNAVHYAGSTKLGVVPLDLFKAVDKPTSQETLKML